MKELAALAYRDTTAENREFWKNEMGQALSEIQQVYEDKLESMRSEMETFYNLKVDSSAVAHKLHWPLPCLMNLWALRKIFSQ